MAAELATNVLLAVRYGANVEVEAFLGHLPLPRQPSASEASPTLISWAQRSSMKVAHKS